MKSINLLAATLSLATIAAVGSSTNVWAQDATKPMTTTNPATGAPALAVPPMASRMDKYKAEWAYRNLDANEVKKYHYQGFSDTTIRGAANIAINTGLEVQYVLRLVRVVGIPLSNIAADYGLSTRTVDSDIPGYGADTMTMAPAMPMAPMAPMAGTMAAPNSMVTPPPANTAPTTGTIALPATASGAVVTTDATSTAPAITTDGAPTVASVTNDAKPTTAVAATGSIVDIAMGNPDLSTFVAAVKAANLVDTLSGPGPFTIFAPTNEAFAKLPAGTVDELLKPENQGKLKGLLTYHVVAGKVMATDVMAMTNPSTPKTLNGATLNVKTTAPVMINGANVTQTDIVGSNGVIHIIDAVLMPPAAQ